MTTSSKPRIFFCAQFILILFLFTSCAKDATEQAMESNANGYLCPKQHKFFTDRSVFAEKCPDCGSLELVETYGFVCETKPTQAGRPPGCGHVTIGPRTMAATACAQCKKPVATVKLPSAQELTAWGARKMEKAQVTQ